MHRIARMVVIGATLLLTAYGVSMLYSTTYAAYGERMLKRQLMWIGVGALLALLSWWKLDYRRLGRLSWWLAGVTAAVLFYLAVANLLYHAGGPVARLADRMPFVTGLSKGAARWLKVGPVTVQPSEFARVILIVLLANYLPLNARHLRHWYRGFVKPLGAAGVLTALILAGGDLSVTIITGAVTLGMAFIGGVRIRYLLLVVGAGVGLVLLAVVASPERMRRIATYREAEKYQAGEGYQLWHSQLALGSGGWTGLGFTGSRMKRFYLPEAHTDFIVAIIGEAWGYLGEVGLLALYLTLLPGMLWIAFRTPDNEGVLLCAGVALTLGIQSFVNVSVVSGFGPTTGVTAPLVSYGGSSMVATLVAVGVVLSVSRQGERVERRAEPAGDGGEGPSAPGRQRPPRGRL